MYLRTQPMTQKCVQLFINWKSIRNKLFQENPVPDNILPSSNKVELCKWLSKFITEVRKKDGQSYPLKTIHHYLLDIQRHIHQLTKASINNLLTDSKFLELRNLLDALYRKLHAAGIGTSSKKTAGLTTEDEDKLWASKVLDPETPQGLLNCVFFLNGKNFCLRGGSEHCDLKISQLAREVVNVDRKSLVRYIHIQNMSPKTKLKDLNRSDKRTKLYISMKVTT